jgi:hypothetical protein
MEPSYKCDRGHVHKGHGAYLQACPRPRKRTKYTPNEGVASLMGTTGERAKPKPGGWVNVTRGGLPGHGTKR